MELTLQRKWPRDGYIIGNLLVDGNKFCHTLEPPRHRSHPCIPAGRYKVVVNYSPKYKKNMPRLLDVPGRSGILIHTGNTAADTLGCILVGENLVVGKVLNSRATFNKLFPLIQAADECYINVVDY